MIDRPTSSDSASASASASASNPPCVPASAPFPEHVLARRGIGGHRQYRIPALAVSARGTILAAYDGRPNLDDLPNPIDLLLRRSTDNGATWEPQQTVRTGNGLDGYGDPSLLVDTETERIFMFHAAGTHAGFFEAIEGLADQDAIQHADLSYSDDDGITWHHRRLTAMLKKPGITGLFAAAGAGIRIHTGPFTGRLVQQFVLLHDGEIKGASVYSDDHGETWSLGEFLAGANENKVVCRSDGSLLLHSRATPHRLTALSTDGGHSYTSAQPHPELPDPSDNGSVARFDGLPNVATLAAPETAHWLIATHNHDPMLRRNTVLKLSHDDGATWPFAVELCGGSSQYSTTARLPDGRIAVLYERQGYQEIVFVTVNPQALLASPASSLTHDGGTTFAGDVCFDVVLRSVTPGRAAVWQSVGESFVLAQTDGDWDPAAWKEVGQGYSEDAPQVLSNRESQDLNYGPVIPGYKSGDVLAFAGRVQNMTITDASDADTGACPDTACVTVSLRNSRGGVASHEDVANGAKAASEEAPGATVGVLGSEVLGASAFRGFTSSYTVTEEDAAAGSLTLTFQLDVSDDARGNADTGQSTVRSFTFDMTTGDISEH